MSQIAGYTWGRELDRMAPEEAVRLTDPLTSGLFYEAYEHRRLLQHDVKGESRRSRGPIICCMDTSASMNSLAALERERFLCVRGLGLALLQVADTQGRPYLGLCFSSEPNSKNSPFRQERSPRSSRCGARQVRFQRRDPL